MSQPSDKDRDKDKKRPVYAVRAGRLSAAVWRNEDTKRGDWYSITLHREYTDAQGKHHKAQTYGRDDLLPAAELLRKCWDWVVTHSTTPGVTTAEPETEITEKEGQA